MKPMPARRELPSDQNATGRCLGAEELAELEGAIDSGTLTPTKGQAVRSFEGRFAEQLGVAHAFACTSGTAAVHLALMALDLEPGDEVVTTSVTDMGALAPILFQGAIPVFADVDPETLLVTPASVEARLSERTRVIIATHLFGCPCDMEGLRRIAGAHGIALIEDAAQAYLARWGDRLVGGLGDLGCFSLQQGKHITTGEGGVVTTGDAELARRVRLSVNKAWPYGEANPDHEFLALNYRMSELVGAVAGAQLSKLADVVAARVESAESLTRKLGELPGLRLPRAPEGGVHSYWKYPVFVDPSRVQGGAVALGARLQEQGIACAPRYIQKPAFRCRVFQERRTFGTSQWPFTLARPEALDWSDAAFPGTWRGLERVLVLPWNERYAAEDVDFIAEAVREAASSLEVAA